MQLPKNTIFMWKLRYLLWKYGIEKDSFSVAGGFFGEEADVVYAAVALGEVHAVADDELVGDLEAYVVGFDGDEAALGLVEAGGDLQRGGLVLEHQAAEVAEGEAGVEDVFDDDDVLALDGVVDVLDELDGAGGDAGAAVAGDGDEVEGVVDLMARARSARKMAAPLRTPMRTMDWPA